MVIFSENENAREFSHVLFPPMGELLYQSFLKFQRDKRIMTEVTKKETRDKRIMTEVTKKETRTTRGPGEEKIN